jgi:hypothetical protein
MHTLLAFSAPTNLPTHPRTHPPAPVTRRPYASRVKVVPQKELNSYPPGLLGEMGWWAPGDRVLHFPGTKGEDFSNAVSVAPDVRYAAAFPRCMAGHEHSAWERAAPGPPPEGAAEGVDAAPGSSATGG